MPTPFQVRGMPNAPSGGLTPYVQRGVITVSSGTTATATISAVNPARSELRFCGVYSNATTITESLGYVSLTNSTTITATRSAGSTTMNISWELTEWK